MVEKDIRDIIKSDDEYLKAEMEKAMQMFGIDPNAMKEMMDGMKATQYAQAKILVSMLTNSERLEIFKQYDENGEKIK